MRGTEELTIEQDVLMDIYRESAGELFETLEYQMADVSEEEIVPEPLPTSTDEEIKRKRTEAKQKKLEKAAAPTSHPDNQSDGYKEGGENKALEQECVEAAATGKEAEAAAKQRGWEHQYPNRHQRTRNRQAKAWAWSSARFQE